MKTIRQGKLPHPPPEEPWWGGVQSECGYCGTVIELENTDCRGGWVCDTDEATGIIKSVKWLCPLCKRVMEIARPVATTSLKKYEQTRNNITLEPQPEGVCPGCLQPRRPGEGRCWDCEDKARIA